MTIPVRHERTKRMAAGTSVLLAGLLLSTSDASVGARPSVSLEQAEADDPDGLGETAGAASRVGPVVGERPSVSGDGRYVVYEGAPSDEDDQRSATVYLTDRETDDTVELTPVPNGIRSGDARFPVISGDGCSVVTVTELQLDVFRDDDTGDRWDVYRSTLPHCEGVVGAWDLVSTRDGSGGLARDDVAVEPATLSRGGTLIAYTHPADHLFDAEGITTISLVDLAVPIDDPSRSRFVAGSPADSPNDLFIHSGLSQPALSGNGEHLAYTSDATSSEAVAGWAPGLVDGEAAVSQVFDWTIAEADPFVAVRLISATAAGEPSLHGAADPDIARDGTAVAFTSISTDLVVAEYPDCSAGCPSQVYLADRDTDDDGAVGSGEPIEVQLLSAQNDSDITIAGSSSSNQPAISADGQLVAFVSRAPNLQLIEAPGLGGGDDGDLLLAEVGKRRLSRLTNVVGEVLPTQGVHSHPDLSDTGRTAVFDSVAAADLLADATLTGRRIVARTSDPLLSLPEIDIGTTLVNVQSDEWYLAVINDGPSSFQPTQVTISDPRFVIDESNSSCLFNSTVPAGGSCTVEVTYTPTAPTTDTATVTISEEGFDAVSIATTVSGSGGNPALRIEMGREEFGDVIVGEPSKELQFDLINIGFVPTDIEAFDLSGEHAGDFAFTTNNCVFRPLNPRAACSVGVTFTPQGEGRRTALVSLTTVSGQYTTIVISGDGRYAPVVAIEVDEVDAGDDVVATGSQYPPNSEVTVVFGDEATSSITAVTDELGAFEIVVPVDLNERGGDRRIVVQSTSGAAASAPIAVIEDDGAQQFIGIPGYGLG